MEEKDFIESGILELYVLDALNPQERLEVDERVAASPRIVAEIRRIEAAMELFALEHKIEPARSFKNDIVGKLDFSTPEAAGIATSVHQLTETDYFPGPLTGRSNWSYYALAASVVLLLVSFASSYNLWAKLQESRNSYADLLGKTSLAASQVSFYKSELNRSKSLLKDPEFSQLTLRGTKTHPGALAVVWWNKKKGTVLLDPNGLKSTDSSHSYQLWAIAGGKPVNAGVFEVRQDLNSLAELNNINSAQAFAITLEPRGGSKSPTMSEMYVISNI